MKNKINELINLNKKLNKYKYGIPYDPNGKIDEKYYKSLSIEEIDKYKMAICWDFTHYYCKTYKGYSTAIMMAWFDEKMWCHQTHTIPIINIDGKYYWAESSWGKHEGIYEFNSKEDCISYVVNKYKLDSKVLPTYNLKVYEYDASSEILVHKTADEFMDLVLDKMSKEVHVKKYNSSIYMKKLNY